VDRGQIGFYIDATRCINCKTCEVACKDFNDAAVGQRIRKVRTFETGEFPDVLVWNISMSCNHCEAPLCVKHCPAGAYTKRPNDGIVVHDPKRCIGCRYCTWLCPYGAPQYDAKEGRVRKCNLCVDEIDAGRSPVCVMSCPMRAIEIGSLEEISARPGATIAIRCLPSPDITRPACRYKVKAEAAK
jgi:anaerobic dimethyl sulfoxide reductase subunit B